MENIGNSRRFEKEPSAFNWRDHLQHPEHMPEKEAAMLDTLIDMLRTDSEADQFLTAFRRGQYKSQPVTALVNFFRTTLDEDERVALSEHIKDCGQTA